MSDSGYTVPTTGGFVGAAWLLAAGNQFTALAFLFDQWLAGRAFGGPVKVLAVYGGGASAGPPTVDVQPMVDQIDGLGTRHPHGMVPRIACFRLQCGTGAIVADPVVGDTGMAIISHSDISTVKNTGSISGPGSRRRNDWADGIYFGGLFGSLPGQSIVFTSGGITIKDANGNTVVMAAGGITMTGTTVTVQGNLQVNGNINATGTIAP